MPTSLIDPLAMTLPAEAVPRPHADHAYLPSLDGLRAASHLIACWTFAYAAAWASYRFVETPGRSLGRRAAGALTTARSRRVS